MSFIRNLFFCCTSREEDTYPSNNSKYKRILPEETEHEKTTIVSSNYYYMIIYPFYREIKEKQEWLRSGIKLADFNILLWATLKLHTSSETESIYTS